VRPAPYDPAKSSTPRYWRHGIIWADGVKYGVWHIGAQSAKRAKKGPRKMKGRKRGR
jgi:hypothetical protein